MNEEELVSNDRLAFMDGDPLGVPVTKRLVLGKYNLSDQRTDEEIHPFVFLKFDIV